MAGCERRDLSFGQSRDLAAAPGWPLAGCEGIDLGRGQWGDLGGAQTGHGVRVQPSDMLLEGQQLVVSQARGYLGGRQGADLSDCERLHLHRIHAKAYLAGRQSGNSSSAQRSHLGISQGSNLCRGQALGHLVRQQRRRSVIVTPECHSAGFIPNRASTRVMNSPDSAISGSSTSA